MGQNLTFIKVALILFLSLVAFFKQSGALFGVILCNLTKTLELISVQMSEKNSVQANPHDNSSKDDIW